MTTARFNVPSTAGGWSTVPLLAAGIVALVAVFGRGDGPLAAATTSAVVSGILVVGLYVFSGNSGVLGFGHVSFMAIGCYVGGFLTIPAIAKPLVLANVPDGLQKLQSGISVAVVAGALVSAVVAAVVFLPVRRLNGLALSISNLALLLITQAILLNVQISPSGGTLTRVPLDQDGFTILPWLLIAVAVAFGFQRSRWGLRLRATRDDEFAARSAGVSIGSARFGAFVLSAGLMGAGGVVYGHTLGSFGASDFYLPQTVLLFAMLVVGGIESLTGALVGTVLVSGLQYVVGEWVAGQPVLGLGFTLPPGSVAVATALLMLVVLIARREGLVGSGEARLPSRRLRSAAVGPDVAHLVQAPPAGPPLVDVDDDHGKG